jgi:hypothetical protein
MASESARSRCDSFDNGGKQENFQQIGIEHVALKQTSTLGLQLRRSAIFEDFRGDDEREVHRDVCQIFRT